MEQTTTTTTTNAANASEQALQQTVFTAKSKHNAIITVDTANKSIVIEYDGKQTGNLYGTTFSTQTRNGKTEFYIPVAKTNIEKYVDENGKEKLHLLFDFAENTEKVYGTLKPNANGKVKQITKPNAHITEYTALYGFYKFINETGNEQALFNVEKNIKEFEKNLADLKDKQKILQALTKSEQARKYFSQIAEKEQKEFADKQQKKFAEFEKIKTLEKMLENLNYENATTVLSFYSFEYYSVSLRNENDGIVFDYAPQPLEYAKIEYSKLAETITAQAKADIEKLQADFERLQETTKQAETVPEMKSDEHASESIKADIRKRAKTVC